MYRALYRKYRPASFRDVAGQEHIVETLKGEIKSGRISHAYLFTGPRGTGKTSCAKILARAVNCLNPVDGDACLECDACRASLAEDGFDISEIDAASNNGVDSIRGITEQAAYAPARFRYRVFIIDEVHMLTAGAYNALLKTLEEPPASAIFILATTEVHKVPATVLSRCQRFDFRRIEPGVIAERLRTVAEKENMDLTPDAADLIAGMADGGMRDALSILDLCAASGGRITEETVENATGTAKNDELISLAEAVLGGDLPLSLQTVDSIYKNSVDMLHLCEQLIGIYRDLMIIKSVKDAGELVRCTKARYSELCGIAGNHGLSRIMLCLRRLADALNRMNNVNRRGELEMAIVSLCEENGEPEPPRIAAAGKKAGEPAPGDRPAPAADISSADDGISPVTEWKDIVERVRERSPLIAAYLDDSKAYFKDDFILIDCPNPQFPDLLRLSEHRDIIRAAAADVLGKRYRLGPYKKTVPPETERDPLDGVIDRWNKFSSK